MAKYITKRLWYAFLTVIFLTTITFFMMQLLPGDPFSGQKAISETTRQALEAKYGLDQSIPVQLGIYFKNVLQGDLGISLVNQREVTDIIVQAFPYSLDLGLRALIFAVVMGVLLGIVAAVKRGTKWDTASMLIALVGVSLPSFVIGAILQYFLGLKLFQWTGIRFFPIMGWTTEASKLLPAFALSFGSMATISRLMRTSMLDVLNQDYIRTAKAKGLSGHLIVWKHAVRNAIMPVITVLGPLSAALLTGAFVIENIFSIPGLGKYFVQSIQTQDYTVIVGTTLFYGIFLVIATLIVDLLYGLIDPRIKLTAGKEP